METKDFLGKRFIKADSYRFVFKRERALGNLPYTESSLDLTSLKANSCKVSPSLPPSNSQGKPKPGKYPYHFHAYVQHYESQDHFEPVGGEHVSYLGAHNGHGNAGASQ